MVKGPKLGFDLRPPKWLGRPCLDFIFATHLGLPVLELSVREGLEIKVLMRIKLSFHGCFLFLLLWSASGDEIWGNGDALKTKRRYGVMVVLGKQRRFEVYVWDWELRMGKEKLIIAFSQSKYKWWCRIEWGNNFSHYIISNILFVLLGFHFCLLLLLN